jgi:hypothetical protein
LFEKSRVNIVCLSEKHFLKIKTHQNRKINLVKQFFLMYIFKLLGHYSRSSNGEVFDVFRCYEKLEGNLKISFEGNVR